MSLDELTRRATITFPILATSEDVERLFGYLRKEEGFIIDYTLIFQKKMGREEGGHLGVPEAADNFNVREAAIVKVCELNGTFTLPPSNFVGISQGRSASWDFHCSQQMGLDETPYFSGLKFFMTPGWDLGEYRPEVIGLWDIVRELAKKYFALRIFKSEE